MTEDERSVDDAPPPRTTPEDGVSAAGGADAGEAAGAGTAGSDGDARNARDGAGMAEPDGDAVNARDGAGTTEHDGDAANARDGAGTAEPDGDAANARDGAGTAGPDGAAANARDGAGTAADAAAGPDDATAEVSRAGAGRAAEQDESDLPVPPLSTLLESVLLVTDAPVPAVTLAQVVERPTGEVEAELTRLSHTYTATGSGFDLRQVAGGWRLYTRAECAPWVERFVRDGQQARLTQAALETLAVVAYRQPVTRARVSAVRGVNVDGVVRSLLARGLIAESGADGETGGTLYVTTPLLLEKLGLETLSDLPSLAPLLPELEEFEQDSMST